MEQEQWTYPGTSFVPLGVGTDVVSFITISLRVRNRCGMEYWPSQDI